MIAEYDGNGLVEPLMTRLGEIPGVYVAKAWDCHPWMGRPDVMCWFETWGEAVGFVERWILPVIERNPELMASAGIETSGSHVLVHVRAGKEPNDTKRLARAIEEDHQAIGDSSQSNTRQSQTRRDHRGARNAASQR